MQPCLTALTSILGSIQNATENIPSPSGLTDSSPLMTNRQYLHEWTQEKNINTSINMMLEFPDWLNKSIVGWVLATQFEIETSQYSWTWHFSVALLRNWLTVIGQEKTSMSSTFTTLQSPARKILCNKLKVKLVYTPKIKHTSYKCIKIQTNMSPASSAYNEVQYWHCVMQ